MTQLRDARLRKALEEAPDAQLRPPARTREAVLAAAHAALQPWWRRAWIHAGDRRTPWTAAFASIALATLVVVMWEGQEVPGAVPDVAVAQRPAVPPRAAPSTPAVAAPAAAPDAQVAPAPAPIPNAQVPRAPVPAPVPKVAPAPPARVAPAAPPAPPAGVAASPASPPPPPAAIVEQAAPAAAPAPAPQRPPPTAAPRSDTAASDTLAKAQGRLEESRAAAPAAARAAPPQFAPPPPSPAAPPAPAPAAVLRAGPAALPWSQVRIEAGAQSVVVPRSQAGELPALVTSMLASPSDDDVAALTATLRLELAQGDDALGQLEYVGDRWRWRPLREPRQARLLRADAAVAEALRAEAVRLMQR
ncbi:MAG TPA: hypothetical protein VHL79_08990 [Ramlibacter sp.]|nr:hypothetical protein [Ramlibacter sp.]